MPFVDVQSSLPRSIDVHISLSRVSTETRTALSVPAVAMENLGFFPDVQRVKFYSTIVAVEKDFDVGTDAHFAASAFFAQTPRPSTMALGEVFLTPIVAENVSSAFSDMEIGALNVIVDGAMDIHYNDGTGPQLDSIIGMDFSSVTTLSEVADVIINVLSSGLNCAIRRLLGGDEVLSITTAAVGDNVSIAYPVDDSGTGTFAADLLKLTFDGGGQIFDGYAPIGIADELSSIANAANAAGEFIYGWALGSSLRTVPFQEAAAAWALPRTAMMTLTSNDSLALDPSNTADIGSIVAATDNRRVVVLYHNNAQRYPDVSILAYMLHVDYRLKDSTVTAKFKQLPGIEIVPLSETEYAILQTKGYNTYTAIGNNAKTYREGITSGLVGWYMDTVINLDNFVEDLETNVFNVFLRNKKVPFTRTGQLLLVDACTDTGNQYVSNGTFADREEVDSTLKSGFVTIPAVQIIPTPVRESSDADRAARIGPPIQMIVQESGAIHSTSINVEIVQ